MYKKWKKKKKVKKKKNSPFLGEHRLFIYSPPAWGGAQT